MAVFNPSLGSCEIYEIKHSMTQTKEQYRHLIDRKKCSETAFCYGDITVKYVIYRGETAVCADTTAESDEIMYINVEEYLKKL